MDIILLVSPSALVAVMVIHLLRHLYLRTNYGPQLQTATSIRALSWFVALKWGAIALLLAMMLIGHKNLFGESYSWEIMNGLFVIALALIFLVGSRIPRVEIPEQGVVDNSIPFFSRFYSWNQITGYQQSNEREVVLTATSGKSIVLAMLPNERESLNSLIDSHVVSSGKEN